MSDSDTSSLEYQMESGFLGPTDTKKFDDDACGRLLEVYVQEAERYDKGLVQSWKEDMDVTLVFSGLYSAVLTAFVIESYQKLQEDPTTLLHRISDQLGSINNDTNGVAGPHVAKQEFTPTSAAVACNILWFLSLLLAICCAFLATFVQQWSRQFLHKTGRLRSPIAHARLLSFLYFGLKDFSMHTVVNVIPSMLHLSLFLFLGGLIAFLQDVNPVLTYIVCVALAIVTAVYIGFTILPLIALNSPYQTPLSPVAWKLWQGLARSVPAVGKRLFVKLRSRSSRVIPYITRIIRLLPLTRRFFNKISGIFRTTIHSFRSIYCNTLPTHRRNLPLPLKRHKSKTSELPRAASLRSISNTLEAYESHESHSKKTDNLSGAVMEASRKPDQLRDIVCITWTLSSLTDDRELLPFIEALPDAIYGPKGLHENNLHLIKPLIEPTDPQADIVLRITSLMTNASNSWFDDKHRTRCSSACPNALYALALMFAERHDHFGPIRPPSGEWLPKHAQYALLDVSQTNLGQSSNRKHAAFTLVLYGSNFSVDSFVMGSAVVMCLQAIMETIELETFEFMHTTSALSECLRTYLPSNHSNGREFEFGVRVQSRRGGSILHRLDEEKPLVKGHMAKLEAVVNLCLQLPVLPVGDAALALKFVSRRVDQEGWGSTQQIWAGFTALSAVGGCGVNRDSCKALRECTYARLPPSYRPVYRTQEISSIWSVCARVLAGRPTSFPTVLDTDDGDKDTSQIALETMLAAGISFIDAPGETAEMFVDDDIKFAHQYVELNGFRLGSKSWSWQNPLHGEDVKASQVVILATRLLWRFSRSPDDPLTAADILDALEFILYIAFKKGIFDLDVVSFGSRDPSLGRPIGPDIADLFSKSTLSICEWWAKSDPKHLSHNALNIVAWIWAIWAYLEPNQSEGAARNLSEAAALVLSQSSMRKVEECESKEPKRTPAPCKLVAQFLASRALSRRFDFNFVLRRYRKVHGDNRSVHSRNADSAPDTPVTRDGVEDASNIISNSPR